MPFLTRSQPTAEQMLVPAADVELSKILMNRLAVGPATRSELEQAVSDPREQATVSDWLADALHSEYIAPMSGSRDPEWTIAEQGQRFLEKINRPSLEGHLFEFAAGTGKRVS